MKFTFLPINKEYAYEIAYLWKYEDEYSFYNMTEDKDDLLEFLNPDNWPNRTYATVDELNNLVGFFQYEFEGTTLEIGFGLKPELTGRGNGEGFILAGIEYGLKNIYEAIDTIVLYVAAFNIRAIKLYTKLGFRVIENVKIKTNGGLYDFYKMKRDWISENLSYIPFNQGFK